MKVIVALSTAALLLWTAGATHAQWDIYNNDSPRWKMEATGLALDRPGDDNGLVLISDDLTLTPLFVSGQATDLNTSPGMDVSLQYFNRFGMEMEIEGMLAHWDRSDQFIGPGLATPFVPDVLFDEINYGYDSDLFSLEWNFRQEFTPGVTLMWGPRFVYLEEVAAVDATAEIIPPIPFPPFDLNASVAASTKNPLLGLQVGAEWDFQLTRDMYAEGFIKAGVYENFSSSFLVREVTGFDPIESEATKNAGSFVGELGGRIYYSIIPSGCSLFVGYEAQWIDNVALAPVQMLTFDNPDADVILGVTPFFHGAVFGLEFLH